MIGMSASFRKRHELAIDDDGMIGAAVVRLLASCRPSAIAGSIRAAIVDAIKTAPVWPRTHVRKERRKVAPRIANCDTAPTVTWVIYASRVKATLLHALPRPVGGSLGHRMRARTTSGRWDFDGHLCRLVVS